MSYSQMNSNSMYAYPSYMQGMGMMPAYSQPSGAYTATSVPGIPAGSTIPGAPGGTAFGALPSEESFVENILRLNLGKLATIYMTFENNSQWNAKVFHGVLEAAGRDHIIISDPKTGMRYLLLTVNLDYITFNEELNYNLPFGMPTTR